MKKAEQTRRENSGDAVNTQRQNSTTGDAPDVLECQKAIRQAVAEIDNQLAGVDSDFDKLLLLGIRQHLSPLHDYWKNSPVDGGTKPVPVPTPPEPLLPTIASDPFPTHEDPRGVAGPLYHVRDSYEEALKKEHEDGFSSLINLWQCIEHHPGLRAETAALQMLTEGSNALNALSIYHSRATESSNDLTGAEVWLMNLLNTVDKSVTTQAFLLKLLNAPERLRKNPKTVALANVIQGMLDANYLLWKMRMWLSSL